MTAVPVGKPVQGNKSPTYDFDVEFVTVDMTDKMKEDALRCTSNAIKWYPSDNQKFTQYIKDEFNKINGKYWQCIVGQAFANSVDYNTGHYICFDVKEPKLRVLLFQTN